MTGYTRQSTADIVAGEPVNGLPLANEFNAIQSAFNATTGHAHDGSTGNGPKINLTTSVTARLPYANFVEVGNYKLVGNVSGSTGNAAEVTIYDEDNMASNSATGVPTQQSVKAYVDGLDAANQPLDALLTAISALSTSADQMIYTTGTDTVALTTITSQARGLLDDTSYSAMRTTLGLAIGTDVQAYDADLTRLSNIGLGTNGYVLTTDGSSNYTWTLPTATAIKKSFVATGSIAAGDAVVLLSDGTVETVSGTYTDTSIGTGYTVTVANAQENFLELRYDSVNSKVYAAWISGAATISIQVGTISGTTITFGTAATITFGSSIGTQKRIGLDIDTTNQKFVVAVRGNWSGTTSIHATAGSVSGTTITLGTPTNAASGGSGNDVAFVKYNSGASVWIVGATQADDLFISAATISGTALTFGSQVTVGWDASNTGEISDWYNQNGGSIDTHATVPVATYTSPDNLYYVDNSKLYLGYFSAGGQVRVASFSGTTITLGSAAATSSITTDGAYPPLIEKLEADKFITTRVNSSTQDFEVSICTVSGTTVTVGSWYVVMSARDNTANWVMPNAMKYDSTLGKILLFFEALSDGATESGSFVAMISYTGTTPTVQSVVPYTNTLPRFNRASVFVRGATNEFVVLASLENYYGVLAYFTGTVSGSSLSMTSSPTVIKSDAHYGGNAQTFGGTSFRSYAVQMADDGFLWVWGDMARSVTKRFFAGKLYKESTNANYYIGVAEDTVTNGQNVDVYLNGTVVGGLSGLTTRSSYYLNADGTIQTTATDRPFGTALSTTEILMV